MRICLLSDQFANRISGIGVHTNNMVDGLLDKGHEVTLICNEPRPKDAKDINYRQMPRPRADITHNGWLSLALGVSRKITKFHKEDKYDIFHSLDARQGALAAKKLDIPTLGNHNDYYFATSPWNPLYFLREYRSDGLKRWAYNNFIKLYERAFLNNFDILIANSKATQDGLTENYGIDKSKTRLLYKAIQGVPKIKPKYPKSDEPRVLLIGGNLQRKGIFYLVGAARQVIDAVPDVKFTVVGHVNKEIKAALSDAGVADHFELLELQPPKKISELYESSSLFVLPSLEEGLGVVIIEAMSHGLPVVASHVGGIKDLVHDRKTGMAITPRDSNSLASALIEVLTDAKLAGKLSSNGYEYSKNFTAENQVRQTEKLYKSLL